MKNADPSPHFLALFLALSLALPADPALALRNEQPVYTGLEEEIAQALGHPAAGAEELTPEQVEEDIRLVREDPKKAWLRGAYPRMEKWAATPIADALLEKMEWMIPILAKWIGSTDFDISYHSAKVLTAWATVKEDRIRKGMADIIPVLQGYLRSSETNPKFRMLPVLESYAENGIAPDRLQGTIDPLIEEMSELASYFPGVVSGVTKLLKLYGKKKILPSEPAATFETLASLLNNREFSLKTAGQEILEGYAPHLDAQDFSTLVKVLRVHLNEKRGESPQLVKIFLFLANERFLERKLSPEELSALVKKLMEGLDWQDSREAGFCQEILASLATTLPTGYLGETSLRALIAFLRQPDTYHTLFSTLRGRGLYPDLVYNRAITAVPTFDERMNVI